jgi:hypothetical protein
VGFGVHFEAQRWYIARSKAPEISRLGMDEATMASSMARALVRSQSRFALHHSWRVSTYHTAGKASTSRSRQPECSTDGRAGGSLAGRSGGTHAQTSRQMNCCPMCLKIQCFRGGIVAASRLGQGWGRAGERRSSVARGAAGAVDRL